MSTKTNKLSLSYSDTVLAIEDAVRQKILAMKPGARSEAIKRCKAADTHCYAWLRGDMHALSSESLDDLMEKAGVSISPHLASLAVRRHLPGYEPMLY